MALTTRCPQCGAAFRVVADQLRVRNGLVRCGECATVFDGRACLVPAADAGASLAGAPPVVSAPPSDPPFDPPYTHRAAPEPVAPVPATQPPPAVLRGRADMQRGDVPPADEDEPDAMADGAPEDEADWDAAPRPEPEEAGWRPILPRAAAHDDREPAFRIGRAAADEADADAGAEDAVQVPGEVRTRYSNAVDSGRTPPEFLDDDRTQARQLVRRLWAYACVLGVLALAAQLVYVYRGAIAGAAPALRPVLEQACVPLQCSVDHARRIERISITSSSLRPAAGAAQGDDARSRLTLNVVLRNRYDRPQEWPALALDLTDISDTVVARKIILPHDYLPSQAGPAFAAGGEINLAIPIEVSGLQVNGYQLDKFFP